ncbi:MAG: AEC family transporter [Alphaproteobacteria bacterium]
MSDLVLTLMPIFAVIAVGLVMKRVGFPGDGFWQPAERLIYYVLLPALLVRNLAGADLAALAIGPLIGAVVAAFVAVAALFLLIGRLLGQHGPSFATAFMGAIRFNTYAGLAAVIGIHAGPGLALFSVLIGVMIPILNVLSVAALVRHVHGGGVLAIAAHILRNPLVLGCAGGLALNVLGVAIPDMIGGVLDILARTALGVALLAVGAGLTPQGLRTSAPLLVGATVVKLAILPLAVALACAVVGVGGVERGVAILYATLPSSPQGYVLARQLGGDGALIAAIISGTTALGILTMPLMLGLLT